MRLKSLNIKVPRLGINRFGVYYVRSSVLGATGRRKVIQHSLGTKNPQLAKVLALELSLNLVSEDFLSNFRNQIGRYELDLATGKAQAEGPEDHARLLEVIQAMGEAMKLQTKLQPAPAAPLPPPASSVTQDTANLLAITTQLIGGVMPSLPKSLNVGKKLRDALKEHLSEGASSLESERTIGEKQLLFNDFVEVFGDDCYLNQITTIEITNRWRPVEFARMSRKSLKNPKKVSRGYLEKRRGYLRKFFAEAKKGGLYLHESPMSQEMASKKEISAQRRPFKEYTGEDLKVLFSAEYARGMEKPDWYWIPLMSMYSGARLGELTNLLLHDFEVVDGIKVFFIPESKTVEGRRTVPIHSVLMQLGLWDFVEFLKEKGETHLLALRPESDRSGSVGEQWAKWVDRCGIMDKRKVFHSFRSTAITDMYNSEAPNPVAIRDSVGHTNGGLSGAHGGYARSIVLKRLQNAIESLGYPTVDLVGIKLVDPTFASFYEEEKARVTSPEYAAQREKRKRHAAAKAEREARVAKQRKRQPKVPTVEQGGG